MADASFSRSSLPLEIFSCESLRLRARNVVHYFPLSASLAEFRTGIEEAYIVPSGISSREAVKYTLL